jgi:hypothetical protein
MKVEKKNTNHNKISSLKNVNNREKDIKLVISMSFKKRTIKNSTD